jgi:SAM-dependent methyltransferase
MVVAEFLELFIKELEINPDLRGYYRLLDSKSRYLWRKSYLEQRLLYVNDNLNLKGGSIWDVGCGYATTAIFLALNGYHVTGNTLEFYYDKIGNRLDYWSNYGNLSNLRVEYANLFDMSVTPQSYDAIIAQDTLHHLEPIQEAIAIFNTALKPGGKLIVTEENGHSIFINLKNFSKRGFKKVAEYYDEQLQKTILFGNENARSLKTWKRILANNRLEIKINEAAYIRFFPPCCFTPENYRITAEREGKLGKKCPVMREMFFFGVNFTAVKTNNLT